MTQDMKKDTILHTIAKRLVCNGRTRVRQGAHCNSLTGVLRTMLLLLMMMLGVSEMWGQKGIWYIANDNSGSGSGYNGVTYANATKVEQKYYLVPAKDAVHAEGRDAYY